MDDSYRRFAKAGVEGFVLPEEDPVAPDLFAHLLVWHKDIRNRMSRGMGFEPILLTEIEAYFRLYRLDYELLDVELLCRLDNVWQNITAEATATVPPPPKPTPINLKRPPQG